MQPEDPVFPWPPYYNHFKFFEERMREHSKVSQINFIGDGVYEITLISGRILRIFICECYSYGVAEYIETIEALGKLDAIIINSMWCGYTSDAHQLCLDQKVGLYKIAEFMSALRTL